MTMLSTEGLLSSDEVVSFLVRGYHVIEPFQPSDVDAQILARLQEDPDVGYRVLERVPEVRAVYEHPAVTGAVASLLGPDARLEASRFCHANPPGSRSQYWHRDGNADPRPGVNQLMALYYPQDVTADMGPTTVLPGSQYRSGPSDQMASYANFVHQAPLIVPAGSVVLVHFDLWHAGTANRSDRMRYMVKVVFTRTTHPEAPSWRHEGPEEEAAAASRLTFEFAGAASQQDKADERARRQAAWAYLLGHAPSVTFAPPA
jgi:hypothetical protein